MCYEKLGRKIKEIADKASFEFWDLKNVESKNQQNLVFKSNQNKDLLVFYGTKTSASAAMIVQSNRVMLLSQVGNIKKINRIWREITSHYLIFNWLWIETLWQDLMWQGQVCVARLSSWTILLPCWVILLPSWGSN